MPTVHPSAIVGDRVVLADDVQIGPFCVLTGEVTLAPGVRLIAHVSIQGPCTIGERTVVYPNASIGFEPQDFKFKPGSPTAGVRVGSDCLIREHVTIHAASKPERPTTVGDRVLLMVNSHMGHDAIVHDDAILVNNVMMGGHSEVYARAIMSGGSMLHQFGRVGRLAMCSGGSVLSNDVPPFCMTANRNTLVGLNLVGLRRSGMPQDEINAVKRAFGQVFRANPPRAELLGMLDERGETSAAVAEMAAFVRASKRSICPVGGRRTHLTTNAPTAEEVHE